MTHCELGSLPFTGAQWIEDTASSIQGFYGHLHPYIAVALCVAGTIMNLTTVLVLTRPSMLSPVNVLLCAVAVCDVLVMTSVLIFVTHFHLGASNRCDPRDYDKFWAYFLYFHSQITVILHATSIWLTVLLAQIRVLTIRRATSGPSDSIGSRSTLFLSLLTFLLCATMNMPNMLTFEIVPVDADLYLQCLLPSDSESNSSLTSTEQETYGVVYNVRASASDCGLLKIAYWTNGILFKVVPCFFLTFSIVALLKIISDVATRRKTLAQVMNKKRMPRDHTTPMLVAVLSIFLVAELPQGILHVCNAVFSNETFYAKIYLNLGDLMDLLSLVNSAVNFIIYCAMSRKFRSVFLELLFSCLPKKYSKELKEEWINQYDTSRQRPSGFTDLTRTEQLALTSSSHRPSATSMLLRNGSKENMPKLYTGNLLSVENDHSPRCSVSHSSPQSHLLSPRVSFDHHKREDGRSSLDIHELRLNVPKIHPQQPQKLSRFSPVRVIRGLFEKSGEAENSPQRRLNIIQFETSNVY